MQQPTQISVPSLVRIKPGALDRLGIYLRRARMEPVMVVASALPQPIADAGRKALELEKIELVDWLSADDNSFENAVRVFARLPKEVKCIVGVGGGKALDTAKYIAFLGRLPYFAVPTSLSNDGFCSPQSSLTLGDKRRSFPATLPRGVIIDVDVCLGAPKSLWLSGVGDLVSKLTAVADWKLAFHHHGEEVNDLAALLSDATVYQFLGAPGFDVPGSTLLANALMLNGIAMEICGSSRPASGSEHLVSHALDALSARPRLHGLQVGVASYLCRHLQDRSNGTIDSLFKRTGFWDEIRKDPFSRAEWLEAFRAAPAVKENYYTVLATRDCLPEVAEMIDNDPALEGCFAE